MPKPNPLEIVLRIRWLPVVAVALCIAAVGWVVVDPQAYPQGLVLVGAAIALGILERSTE